MAQLFQIKRTSVTTRTPNTTSSGNTSYIAAGELAINLTDGKLFSSNGTTLISIGSNLSSLSVTGNTIAAQINATSIYIGANVVFTTTGISVGNATVNSFLTDTTARIANVATANSTSFKLIVNDILTFNDTTTQNTAFRVYDSTGTRIA